MRKLVINTFLSLDGVMQAPGGPDEDPTGGFPQGGWSMHYWDDAMGQIMGELMARPSEALLGRKTYEIFAAYWPYAEGQPGAAELNSARKYVASRTLTAVSWNNSVLLKGEAAGHVRRLKQENGPELLVRGSGNLAQTLIKEGLVDEYRLWIFPLVLGTGRRLFGPGTSPAGLKLVDSKTSSTGVLMTTYVPDGAIKKGSFDLATPSEAELARRKKLREEG